MSALEKEIKPFLPIPYKNGNTVLKKYDLPFVDRVGNKAIITYVDFKDRKNKVTEKYVMHIKWIR